LVTVVNGVNGHKQQILCKIVQGIKEERWVFQQHVRSSHTVHLVKVNVIRLQSSQTSIESVVQILPTSAFQIGFVALFKSVQKTKNNDNNKNKNKNNKCNKSKLLFLSFQQVLNKMKRKLVLTKNKTKRVTKENKAISKQQTKLALPTVSEPCLT